MRAVQFDQYGEPDVLHLAEVPAPEPSRGQVRVAVHTAGVNPWDWKTRSGAMADLSPVSFPHTPGLELSGVVDAVGDGSGLAVGDPVFGWAVTGAYAEHALASVVTRKPAELSWSDAAALPVAGEAALRGLRVLDVEQSDVLLIHGASGTVGGIATQLAVDRGATVIGTAGTGSAELVRSFGAIPVHYGAGLVERVRELGFHAVDAVLDAAGQGALPDSMALRGTTERIVTLADPAAFSLGITFSSAGDRTEDVLGDLAEHVLSGRVRVVHAARYALSEAAGAQRESATGHSGGKITLEVRSG